MTLISLDLHSQLLLINTMPTTRSERLRIYLVRDWKSKCKLCSTLLSWVLVYTVEHTVEMWSISHNIHNMPTWFIIFSVVNLASFFFPDCSACPNLVSILHTCRFHDTFLSGIYRCLLRLLDSCAIFQSWKLTFVHVGIVVSWFDTGKGPLFLNYGLLQVQANFLISITLVHCRLFSLLFSMHTCLWLGCNGTYMSRHDGTFSFELFTNFRCEDGISWAFWT
jgi:hypothetical protein